MFHFEEGAGVLTLLPNMALVKLPCMAFKVYMFCFLQRAIWTFAGESLVGCDFEWSKNLQDCLTCTNSQKVQELVSRSGTLRCDPIGQNCEGETLKEAFLLPRVTNHREVARSWFVARLWSCHRCFFTNVYIRCVCSPFFCC